MRAKTIGMEDDGRYLMCAESGCSRRLAVQIERPMCSVHQWPTGRDDPISVDHQFAYNEHHTGPKAWATRIIERSKSGTGVTETVLAMARRALGQEV